MDFSAEITMAFAAFAAIFARDGLRWLFRLIGSYVAGTPNKLDDKIWEAVQKGLGDALDAREEKMDGALGELQRRVRDSR